MDYRYRNRSKKCGGRRLFTLVEGCVALAQHGNEKVKYPVIKAMSEYMCRRRKVVYDTSFFSETQQETEIQTKKTDNDDQQKCRERLGQGH